METVDVSCHKCGRVTTRTQSWVSTRAGKPLFCGTSCSTAYYNQHREVPDVLLMNQFRQERLCVKCGVKYIAIKPNQKYCDEHKWCTSSYYKRHNKGPIKTKCAACGHEFEKTTGNQKLCPAHVKIRTTLPEYKNYHKNYYKLYYSKNKNIIKTQLYKKRYPNADCEALITVFEIDKKLRNIRTSLGMKTWYE